MLLELTGCFALVLPGMLCTAGDELLIRGFLAFYYGLMEPGDAGRAPEELIGRS